MLLLLLLLLLRLFLICFCGSGSKLFVGNSEAKVAVVVIHEEDVKPVG